MTVGNVNATQEEVANNVNTTQARFPTNEEGLLSQVSTADDKLVGTITDYRDQTPVGQTSATVQATKAKVADAECKTKQLASALMCTP